MAHRLGEVQGRSRVGLSRHDDLLVCAQPRQPDALERS